MTRRFQIEDLVSQDEHGVVFQAVDLETGRGVAVRRIFPFGPDGDGLKGELAAAYEIGVRRFSTVEHPGLRTVIAGGCDPVDGMPFLATEWVEGPTLAKALAKGPIAVASVVALMDRALEVGMVLSEALAEESVWVETAPSAIVVSSEDAERGFTFWVSPLIWLHDAGGRRGLSPLVKLFKTVTERLSPADNPQVIAELKRWGLWLATNATVTTLQEARRKLHETFTPQEPAAPAATATATASANSGPPSSYAGVVKPPGAGGATQQGSPGKNPFGAPVRIQPAIRAPKKKSLVLPFVIWLVVMAGLGGAGFQYWRYQQAKKTASLGLNDSGGGDEIGKIIRQANAKVAGDLPPGVTPASGAAASPAKPLTVIPAGHPILGAWKYRYSNVSYIRTFTTEKGVSYCTLTVNGKVDWKYKVALVTDNDVIVKDARGTDMHNVLSADHKQLTIESKYEALR